jgi:excisionase family DNA binding protein
MKENVETDNLPPAGKYAKYAFRVNEACRALGIGRTSLYELVKLGQLKLIRIAGRSLVPISEIERLTRVKD